MPANIDTASITIASSVTLRLHHLAGCIYPLGPRTLFELMREIASASSAALDRFEAYARIDPDVLDRFGGRDLPPTVRLIK